MNSTTILAARFSDNIQHDIARGWSAYQTEIGNSYEDCIWEAMNYFGYDEEGAHKAVREFPEFPGTFGVFHHAGLSAYLLNADNIDDAVKEAIENKGFDGSGFGIATIGKVTVLKTIPAAEIGSIRDLHILEIEDYKSEE